MSIVSHPARVFITLQSQGCVCLSYSNVPCTQPGMIPTIRIPALPSSAAGKHSATSGLAKILFSPKSLSEGCSSAGHGQRPGLSSDPAMNRKAVLASGVIQELHKKEAESV